MPRRLTIRMSDEKYERLKGLARRRSLSLNRLIGEMTELILAELDAEARFRMRAASSTGNVARGIELLRKAQGL